MDDRFFWNKYDLHSRHVFILTIGRRFIQSRLMDTEISQEVRKMLYTLTLFLIMLN